MWLHIRGVGEWTNTLYSYFEREQERLHNGEVPPYIPPSSSRNNTLESKATLTPQKDFLSRNLARLNHGSMAKASSLDNPRCIEDLQESMHEDDTPLALVHSENETQKSNENPFTFAADDAKPARPPRATDEPKTPSASGPAKPRRLSETTSPIKKIQATLQRTFSRKGSSPQDGCTNDGYISDDGKEATPKRKIVPEKTLGKAKAPLEKSLSMPDIDNRMKTRKRLMA